jgi:hypothetical protein
MFKIKQRGNDKAYKKKGEMLKTANELTKPKKDPSERHKNNIVN